MSKAPTKSRKTRNTVSTPLKISKERSSEKSRIDRVNILLALIISILLVLIILVLNHEIVSRIFPKLASVNNQKSISIERLSEPDTGNSVPEPAINLPEPSSKPPITPSSGSVSQTQSTARLFFVRVNDEGKISFKSVLRPIPANTLPLLTSIQALIDGPRPGEISAQLLSLIPEGTEIIGARIEAGVAYLDFNEQFRFNTLGIEGYRSQIEQVVYTATEFPSVKKVQFLIEGQRVDYLGGEGFWIGDPLGREDFF